MTIETQVRDPDAVAAACRRLGLAEAGRGTARLYAGTATGLLVRLPGWSYPPFLTMWSETPSPSCLVSRKST